MNNHAAQREQQQQNNSSSGVPRLPSFGQQSIYQVARELKREQHTLYNCLASILSDAAFIQEIRLLYPDIPLLANLRAGGWYAPNPDGTCYFKSTDGHQNNCSFSVTRLNWHVAELAAQRGGVMVVDATRKGKRFPDAMSKTIPIWAAVLNRAVARVRAYDAHKAQRRRTYAAADGGVFTAVADTQTMISVRSEQPPSSNSSSRAAAAAAGTTAAAAAAGATRTACKGAQQQHGEQQYVQEAQEQQQQQDRAAGQNLPQAPEQPRGRHHSTLVQQGSSNSGRHVLTSIDESIQAASAVNSCDSNSSSTQVVQLLVDCLGPSVDLMSGLSSTQDGVPSSPALGSAACGGSSGLQAAGVGGCAGPPCCCLQRSKSAHISPQPSLHEWLDEMDVLRRLTIMAETRAAALRTAPRVSCPAGCVCVSKPEAGSPARAAPLTPEGRAAACSGSAPAVSCLLATAEEQVAPATPAAACCTRPPFVEDVSLFAEAGACPVMRSRCASPVAAPQVSVADGPPSAPLASVSKQAVPALEGLGSPGFLLSSGHAAGSDSDGAGDPVTPRLMFGSNSSGSGRSSSGEDGLWDPVQAAAGEAAAPHAVIKQLRAADQGSASDASSEEVVPGDFAFPSPHQLAASAGSSVGAEAAGHLAASGLGSSGGSSCGSGLVRLPDMPVVVLNGTSHQPGDAASILDIWRGTDLEDVAYLPGISDFTPGVYHMPAGAKPRESTASDDWPNTQQLRNPQQQQQLLQQQAVLDSLCAGDSSGACKPATSWAAEVCLRSQQQLSGRVSVSNWLEDDDSAAAACEALCAFAVPALPPSCASTNGSSGSEEAAAEVAEEATTSCNSAVCEGSQGSAAGSDCSEDSRPSSRQSSSTTAGFSSSAGAGGLLAESSSMGSGCFAAAVESPAAPVEWDTSLHLPLWVSSHEREAIESKLDGWVERLLEVGADVRGLAAVLTKPLRPLWVSQSSLIWTNQVANPSSLPFIPLLLVSASQPHAVERQPVKAAWLSLAKGAAAGSPERPLTPVRAAALSDDSDSGDDSGSDDSDFGDGGLGCSWGSSRSGGASKRMLRGSPSSRQHQRPKRAKRAAGVSHSKAGSGDAGGWSYMYVPGAGDDEESWAAGLTPALFWQHCDALLRCGPTNIKPAVKQLLQLHKSASFGGAAASLAAAAIRGLAAAPAGSSSSTSGGTGRPLSPLGPGNGSSGSGGRGSVPATDQHHPAPQGCGTGGVMSMHVSAAAPGAFWVGNTGLAVGNLEGASAADVWRAVDAVLCCGTTMVPVLRGEYQAMQLAASRVPATLPVTAVSSSAPAASAWMQRQQQQQKRDCLLPEKQAVGDRPLSSSFCTSGSAAHSHWVRQQQQQLAAAGAADSAVAADQVQPSLEFSKVGGAPAAARKPVRKGGMLSALLSKAGAAAAAAAACKAADPAVHVQPAAELQRSGSDGSSEASSVCSSSYYSVCSEDGLSAGPGAYAAAAAGGCGGSSLPRLKWLPIESSKRDRSSLKENLQQALEFVSAHLAAGHTVLLHDVEGHDNCVCMAVAVLSGCFAPPAASSLEPAAAAGTRSGAAEPFFAGAWLPDSPQQAGQDGLELPVVPVSKQSVRQQLALVSGCYPLARPTRGMLKQVFNFYEEHKRDAPAQHV